MRRICTVIGDTKDCTKCGDRKPLSRFSPDRRQSSGLQSMCKDCRHTYMKQRLAIPLHREAIYGARKARRRIDATWFMYTEAKKRAKARGLPFGLERSDLAVPLLCPVLHVPLATSDGHGRDFSPSLDAIVPSLGYIKGNVQIISNLANRMKNSATPAQLVAFASWVLSEFTESSNGQHRQPEAVA